jgi:hypothetical protein
MGMWWLRWGCSGSDGDVAAHMRDGMAQAATCWRIV